MTLTSLRAAFTHPLTQRTRTIARRTVATVAVALAVAVVTGVTIDLGPSLKNQAEVETLVLDAFRARAEWMGFTAISTLIEARVLETGPAWLKAATVVETIEDYLRSGEKFVYVRAAVGGATTES